MLKKTLRLTTPQFNSTIEKGKFARSPLFSVRYTSSEADTRISAAVPIKEAKKAVERNRIRRRVYEAIATLAAKISPGTHAVVFCRQKVLESDFKSMRDELEMVFVKAGLLKVRT